MAGWHPARMVGGVHLPCFLQGGPGLRFKPPCRIVRLVAAITQLLKEETQDWRSGIPLRQIIHCRDGVHLTRPGDGGGPFPDGSGKAVVHALNPLTCVPHGLPFTPISHRSVGFAGEVINACGEQKSGPQAAWFIIIELDDFVYMPLSIISFSKSPTRLL